MSASSTDWTQISDAYARSLLETLRKFEPERLTADGMSGAETEIVSFRPEDHRELNRRLSLDRVKAALEKAMDEETDRNLLADLHFLHEETSRIKERAVAEEMLAPFRPISETMLLGMGRRVRPEHRLARLRKYVDADGPSLVDQAIRLLRECGDDLVMPNPAEVLTEERNASERLQYLHKLFKDDADEDFAVLNAQIERWRSFLRDELLPRAREDRLLPEEVYRHCLPRYGVKLSAGETIDAAKRVFGEAQERFKSIGGDAAHVREIYSDRISTRLASMLYGDLASVIDAAAKVDIDPEIDEAMILPRPLEVQADDEPFVLLLPATSPDYYAPDCAALIVAAVVIGERDLRRTSPTIAGRCFDGNEAKRRAHRLEAEERAVRNMDARSRLIAAHRRVLDAALAFLDPELNMDYTSPEDVRRFLVEEVHLSPEQADVRLAEMLVRSPGRSAATVHGLIEWAERVS